MVFQILLNFWGSPKDNLLKRPYFIKIKNKGEDGGQKLPILRRHSWWTTPMYSFWKPSSIWMRMPLQIAFHSILSQLDLQGKIGLTTIKFSWGMFFFYHWMECLGFTTSKCCDHWFFLLGVIYWGPRLFFWPH